MKTCLITGGAGFIGSTITQKLLENGEKVVVADNFNDFYEPQLKRDNIKPFLGNPNFKIYETDIRNVDGLSRVFDENEIDIVIHLAAMAGVRPSIENPMLYQDVNGMGTQNILEQAKKHDIKKLVMASSSSVYGYC